MPQKFEPIKCARKGCDVVFTPREESQRFHSASCRNKAWAAKTSCGRVSGPLRGDSKRESGIPPSDAMVTMVEVSCR